MINEINIDSVVEFAKGKKYNEITAYSLLDDYVKENKIEISMVKWRRAYTKLLAKLKTESAQGKLTVRYEGRKYLFNFGDKND